ncbi:MAG: hypothetical protein ABR915_03685 [Thermoguttaceae bacterium]|jgi:hypothetical protein
MDTELLVDNRIDDGRGLIAWLVHDGFDVAVAFWAKTSEEGLWFLYLGSTSIEVEKLGSAYSTVYACLRRLPGASLSLSEIKLVHAQNPIARDAIAVRDRVSTRIPIRYQGKRLGNLPIEEAYIYPRSGAMTPNEVVQTVLALMRRAGAVQPSVVSLRNGSSFHAVPHGIQGGLPGEVQIVLRDVASDTDRVIPAGDVMEIQ